LRYAREAKSLFVDLAKTGEGGESLLFFRLTILKLPQILCKMDLNKPASITFRGVGWLLRVTEMEKLP